MGVDLFKDLAREKSMSGIIDLYDIDRPMAEQNAVIGTRLFDRPDVAGDWTFEVSGSLKELLEKKKTGFCNHFYFAWYL